MPSTRKLKKVKGYGLRKDLFEIDQLFRKLGKDKSLPTFGEHFIFCLTFGIARKVDLQALYPKHYKELSGWLKRHNQKILAMQKDRR